MVFITVWLAFLFLSSEMQQKELVVAAESFQVKQADQLLVSVMGYLRKKKHHFMKNDEILAAKQANKKWASSSPMKELELLWGSVKPNAFTEQKWLMERNSV